MKITGWPTLLVLLCGVLGYLAGRPSPPPFTSHQSVPFTDSAGPLSRSAAPWKTQLAAARLAPASRSERAWIKWAFAVPDAEIPAAVARLNPLADFHALRLLFARWVQLDAASAWKAFDALPIPERNVTWYGDHEEDGLAMGNSSHLNDPRAVIIGRMLHSWHRIEPASAMAYAKKLKAEREAGGRDHSGYAEYQIKQFIEDNNPSKTAGGNMAAPAEQAVLDLALPASYERKTTLRKTLEQWAGQDGEAAARWFLALPEAQRIGLDFELWVDSTFRKSPPALKSEILASGLRTLGISRENITAFLRIPKGQEGMHPESYETTARLRQSAEALNQWAVKDPAAAQSWLAAQPEDALKSLLSGELAGTLSRTSPSAAIALLKDLPDEQLPTAVVGLTAGWMQKDAAACAAWVAKIGDPETREACQQTMARSIMASDPALALRLSTQITDETVRREIQNTITNGLSWNPAGLEKIVAADPAVQASLNEAKSGLLKNIHSGAGG